MSHVTVQDDGTIELGGDWTLAEGPDILSLFESIAIPQADTICIDGANINTLDSSGALVLCQLLNRFKKLNKSLSFKNFNKKHENLLSFTDTHEKNIADAELGVPKHNVIYRIGVSAVSTMQQTILYTSFIGHVSTIFANILTLRRSWQWRSTLHSIEQVGNNAIPIISLLMFLIGIVLSYQLGLQLESYGANIYLVNLTGLAMLREFGPLIAAIIAAGRTSSSFTAEIGLMKANEELDALAVMGLSPINRIVLPKILAVVIAMPLLTIIADGFGVFGAMVMGEMRFSITMQDFIQRFDDVTDVSSLWTGLFKAPFFGLIIGSVGCFQGLQVEKTADSIGRLTTRSVVQAIFLVIVADALFSIFFSVADI